VAGDTLNEIAQAHHASPKQIALAWLLQRSPIVLPIPGTSSIEHLEEDIAAAYVRLTKEEYERLAGVPELVALR
jgi:aryl-alcohol dehydrogenase-like predicted oxidoreductase